MGLGKRESRNTRPLRQIRVICSTLLQAGESKLSQQQHAHWLGSPPRSTNIGNPIILGPTARCDWMHRLSVAKADPLLHQLPLHCSYMWLTACTHICGFLRPATQFVLDTPPSAARDWLKIRHHHFGGSALAECVPSPARLMWLSCDPAFTETCPPTRTAQDFLAATTSQPVYFLEPSTVMSDLDPWTSEVVGLPTTQCIHVKDQRRFCHGVVGQH